MNPKFTHLHTHSHYSLLAALPKIDQLVERAKQDGMDALALTDNGNLYGAIEFYKECKKHDIKPIIGVDAYLAVRTRFDRQAGVDNRRSRLVLLAKNMIGYKNLIQLVTLGNTEGFYYKPRVDKELLEKFHDGLICISPSFSGDIVQALKNRDSEKAAELANFYKRLFSGEKTLGVGGNGDFYIEITHHPEIADHEENMNRLVEFAAANKIPIMAAHDVYYLDPGDAKARETMMAIQSNSADMSDRNFDEHEDDFSFINAGQAEKYFKKLPEALENTAKIAAECNLELTLGTWIFPDFKIESGLSADLELRRLVDLGFAERSLEKTAEAKNRVEYELGIIKDKGFARYFLVVADMLTFARNHGILTTTRGSAGGSLVSYLVGVTTINPLEYKLPFERFLNPERPKAPDIDMDCADDRRDEMIEYAKEKYGFDRVAQIGTFGTMAARGAVRDIARALGHPYNIGDKIAKLIPIGSQGFPMTINRAMEIEPELAKMYKTEAETKEIIDTAKKIEGCARHISVHAAGVVIAPSPLLDWTPLQFDPKGAVPGGKGGKIITQYDMYSITDEYGGVGLLKFDFLGIKNLSILAQSVKLVKKIEGVDIDIGKIPIDDKKTFEMLARGETEGLFQLNGSGMTHFLKDLKPSVIHDINAMVALYRPGPMESIPQYIERKHNPKLVKYLDPRLKDILDQSYGVITYQDDVMLIAVKLGGYSWLVADALRKAMGKKIPAEMEAQKDKLIAGFIKNGMSADKANKLWKLIEPFAAYGFNKAHAASYGKVAYQTAYMKANFPAIYMSAVLTADSGNIDEIAKFVAECKRMKIPVLPPSINESIGRFTVIKNATTNNRQLTTDNKRPTAKEDLKKTDDEGVAAELDAIRFGLYTIKNFGEGIADAIIAERQVKGRFTSLADFLNRIKDKNLNKKSLEALIKAGAMDDFGERGQMLGNLDDLLKYNKESATTENQDSLFGLMTDQSSVPVLRLRPAEPANSRDKLAWEKEHIGLYISGHPLDNYKEKLTGRDMTIKDIRERLKEGMTAIAYGILEEVKPLLTKNNDKMLFIKIADYTGSIEAVVFPKVLKQYEQIFMPDACVAIKGRLSKRNDAPSIVVEKAKAL